MDVDRSQQKKIRKYIEKDKYLKLKKYLQEEKIGFNDIVTKHGEKMVHLAAKEGSKYCLEFLLNQGANAKLVDKKGNLPLHRALMCVIDDYSPENEKCLVSILLTFSSGLLNTRNKAGYTPKELMLNLEKAKGKIMGETHKGQVSSFSKGSFGGERKKTSEEDEWREKLAAECDEEYHIFAGKFEDDYSYEAFIGAESFGQFADRIYEELSARRRKLYAPVKTSRPHQERKSLKPNIDLEEAGKNYELLKKANFTKKQKKMCKKIFELDGPISADDIPFQNMEASDILDVLLGDDIAAIGAEGAKKKIREELRRWHPDKFKQKNSDRIVVDQTELVMERVMRVSQVLISFGK